MKRMVYSTILLGLILTQDAFAQEISLFQSNLRSMEWLLTDHEGAKKFRKGESCYSCHEEGGEKLTDKPFLTLDVGLEKDDEGVLVSFQWVGPESTVLAMMVNAGSSKAFERAGCWAACHNDVDGMSEEAVLSKYLGRSRIKMSKAGGGENIKQAAQLEKMESEGKFINITRVEIQAGNPVQATRGSILAELKMEPDINGVTAEREGQDWKVRIRQKLSHDRTTVGFGILQEIDGETVHFLSLPMVFDISGGGTRLLDE